MTGPNDWLRDMKSLSARRVSLKRRRVGIAKLRTKRLARTPAQRATTSATERLHALGENGRARPLYGAGRNDQRCHLPMNLTAVFDEVQKWQAPAMLRALADAQASPYEMRRR